MFNRSQTHYIIPEDLLYKLTLSQLKELGMAVPEAAQDKNFLSVLVKKQFHYELNKANQEIFTLPEKKDNLERMLQAASNHP